MNVRTLKFENYADDELQSTSDELFTCFKNNHMRANPEKYRLLLTSKTPTESLFGGSSIKSSRKEDCLVF